MFPWSRSPHAQLHGPDVLYLLTDPVFLIFTGALLFWLVGGQLRGRYWSPFGWISERRQIGQLGKEISARPHDLTLRLDHGKLCVKHKQWKQAEALAFVGVLLAAPIPKIALENPISIISTHFRKPEQIIQPWMFGHGETKAMCLWLQGLLPLTPTDMVEGRANRIHMMPGSKNQAKNRSRFYPGVAQAMAEQWG